MPTDHGHQGTAGDGTGGPGRRHDNTAEEWAGGPRSGPFRGLAVAWLAHATQLFARVSIRSRGCSPLRKESAVVQRRIDLRDLLGLARLVRGRLVRAGRVEARSAAE